MVFEFSDGEPTFEKLTLKFARREFALQFKDALDHARALNNVVGSDDLQICQQFASVVELCRYVLGA